MIEPASPVVSHAHVSGTARVLDAAAGGDGHGDHSRPFDWEHDEPTLAGDGYVIRNAMGEVIACDGWTEPDDEDEPDDDSLLGAGYPPETDDEPTCDDVCASLPCPWGDQ